MDFKELNVEGLADVIKDSIIAYTDDIDSVSGDWVAIQYQSDDGDECLSGEVDTITEDIDATKIVVSREDLDKVLKQLSTEPVKVIRRNKNKKFARDNSLDEEDIKNVLKQLQAGDYSYSKISTNELYFGNVLTVFITNKPFQLKDRVLDSLVVYIKIDATEEGLVTVISIHEATHTDLKHPYEKERDSNQNNGEPEVSQSDAKQKIQDEQLAVDKSEDFEEKEIPPAPEGDNTGIANLINALIKDEWDAIDGYQTAIATLRSLSGDNEDAILIFQEIANDEYSHIGNLQKILDKFAPQASTIADGAKEAEETIAVNESLTEAAMGYATIKDKHRKGRKDRMSEDLIRELNNIPESDEVDTAVPVTMAAAKEDDKENVELVRKSFKDLDKLTAEFIRQNDNRENKVKGAEAMEKMELMESLFEDYDEKECEKVKDEVLEILYDNGYDVDSEDVQNYAWDAADYICMTRDYGEEYSVEQWWEDTSDNYPEALEELPVIEGLSTFSDEDVESVKEVLEDAEIKDWEKVHIFNGGEVIAVDFEDRPQQYFEIGAGRAFPLDKEELPEEMIEVDSFTSKGSLGEAKENKPGMIGHVLEKYADDLAKLTNAQEAIDFLNRHEDEIQDKKYLEEVKRNLARKRGIAALTYLYNIILKGEDKGRDKEESLKEDYSEDEFKQVKNEVLEVLEDAGYDISKRRTQNYASDAADYICMTRGYGEEYSVDEWWEDTSDNYPEALRRLPKTKSLKEGKEEDKLKKEFESRDLWQEVYDAVTKNLLTNETSAKKFSKVRKHQADYSDIRVDRDSNLIVPYRSDEDRRYLESVADDYVLKIKEDKPLKDSQGEDVKTVKIFAGELV